MVVTKFMGDLFNVSSKFTTLSLPTCKENGVKISLIETGQFNTRYHAKEPPLPFAESELYEADIISWRKLTADDENVSKRAYEVTFDITGSNFKFHPGDSIGILPQNSLDEVDSILKHLGLLAQADWPYEVTIDASVKGAKIPSHLPVESTLRHVFTHCLDLRCVIKKLFLLALSKHTKKEDEKKVLEYLSSKEGSSTYNTHILEKNFSIIDLFRTFRSCRPPVEVLLSHLPRLFPRPYSIANSQLEDEDQLTICFSVMEIGHGRKGLTTGYLEQILLSNDSIENRLENMSLSVSKSRKIVMYSRKNMNGFVLPEGNMPLLLIGPGTGVAPFIGFLGERSIMKKRNSSLSIGDAWLFFGCRNPDTDHIYKKELDDFVRNGILKKLTTAFSRIENGGVKYVQDAIQKEGESVVRYIENGASIFVCGDLKTMAAQVRDTLKQCLVTFGGKNESESEDFIAQLERERKYVVDIWS